jgi:hypothetical protein
MKDFAVIKNGLVSNIAVAETIEHLFLVIMDADAVIEVTEATGVPHIGFEYREDKGRFVPMRPGASWSFDEEVFQWLPPTPYPTDGNIYSWDEPSLSWAQVDIPENLVA